MNVKLKRFAAACGLVGLLTAPGAALAQSGHVEHVRIGAFGTFGPQTLSVQPGTTITWTNMGPSAQTVTTSQAPNEGFDSGEISEGGTFSVTLWEPGYYVYYSQYRELSTSGAIWVSASP